MLLKRIQTGAARPQLTDRKAAACLAPANRLTTLQHRALHIRRGVAQQPSWPFRRAQEPRLLPTVAVALFAASAGRASAGRASVAPRDSAAQSKPSVSWLEPTRSDDRRSQRDGDDDCRLAWRCECPNCRLFGARRHSTKPQRPALNRNLDAQRHQVQPSPRSPPLPQLTPQRSLLLSSPQLLSAEAPRGKDCVCWIRR